MGTARKRKVLCYYQTYSDVMICIHSLERKIYNGFQDNYMNFALFKGIVHLCVMCCEVLHTHMNIKLLPFVVSI